MKFQNVPDCLCHLHDSSLSNGFCHCGGISCSKSQRNLILLPFQVGQMSSNHRGWIRFIKLHQDGLVPWSLTPVKNILAYWGNQGCHLPELWNSPLPRLSGVSEDLLRKECPHGGKRYYSKITESPTLRRGCRWRNIVVKGAINRAII